MLKIFLTSTLALAVLGWFTVGPSGIFTSEPPPTIRAEPGPFKHRPPGYAAAQQRHRATQISAERDDRTAAAIDLNLILPR